MKRDSSIKPLLFALWGETINRIDALLLEIRHVQLNIVRDLRENHLYKALEYEEDYLWGSFTAKRQLQENYSANWFEYFDEYGIEHVNIITNAWIVKLNPYSFLCDRHGNENLNNAAWDKVCSHSKDFFCKYKYRRAARMADDVYRARDHSRGYGPVKTQLYHSFTALQSLKANILKDKIIFSYWAEKIRLVDFDITTSLDDVRQPQRTAIGRFITIRNGVLFRTKKYVERLEDIRLPLERSTDISVADNPRPMTTRRKEQGHYNEFLMHRSLRYFHVLKGILKKTRDIRSDELNTEAYLSHRWSHQTSSQYAEFKNETLSAELVQEDTIKDHHYLNTSFWMVDRPDLQPIIAHEIAHYFMLKVFKDVGESKLTKLNGEFSELFRRISKVLYFYQNPDYEDDDFPIQKLEILRELGADLIASQRNALPYLWSLFLEIVGLDLHIALQTPDSLCDLEALLLAEQSGFILDFRTPGPLYSSYLWSIRLLAVCDWVEAVDQQNKGNPLAEELIKGIRLLTMITVRYTEENTPLKILGDRGVKFHDKLANALCLSIKNSAAAKHISKLQNDLNRETDRAQYGQPNKEYDAEIGFPFEFKEYLVNQFIKLKERRSKSLGVKLQDIAYEYFGESEKNLANGNVLKYIQDVAWTAYLLRGRDCVALCDGHDNSLDRITDQIYNDFSPGDDLYTMAHEAQTWLRSRATRRLRRVARYISDLVQDIDEFLCEKYGCVIDDATGEQFAVCWNTLMGLLPKKHQIDKYKARTGDHIHEYDHIKRILLPKLRAWVEKIDNKPPFGLETDVRQKKAKEFLDEIKETLNLTITTRTSALRHPFGHKIYAGLESLNAYLSVCTSAGSSKQNKKNMERLIEIIRISNRPSDTNNPLPTNLLRMSIGAPIVTDRKFRRIKSLHKRSKIDFDGSKSTILRIEPVLGRYDFLAYGTEQYSRRLPVPLVQGIWKSEGLKSGSNKKPISIRSERVLPLLLENSQPLEAGIEQDFFAMMEVSLTGRDSRMDVLLALDKAHQDKRGLAKAWAAKYFDSNTDRFCLTEGRSDIIILFNGAPMRRLSDVIQFQRNMRQHILIESVETIFSPKILNAILEQWRRSAPDERTETIDKRHLDYSLIIQLRLRSDRNLNATVDIVENHLSKLSFLTDIDPSLQWSRVSGRLDYELFIPFSFLPMVLDRCQRDLLAAEINGDLRVSGCHNLPLNWLSYCAGLINANGNLNGYPINHLIDEELSNIGFTIDVVDTK